MRAFKIERVVCFKRPTTIPFFFHFTIHILSTSIKPSKSITLVDNVQSRTIFILEMPTVSNQIQSTSEWKQKCILLLFDLKICNDTLDVRFSIYTDFIICSPIWAFKCTILFHIRALVIITLHWKNFQMSKGNGFSQWTILYFGCYAK